jgi:CRP/FNR family transcriptional regulator, dissimilatory nitrate respiration regulator
MHIPVQFPTRRPGRTIDLLAHAPIFKDVPQDNLERIAAGTTEIRVERGRLLFQRGDPCVGFHIVVFGQVKLSVGTAAGAEKVVEIIGPGMTFGEALMFTDRPYVVSATALVDSLLLHVDKSVLDAELERDPRLARRMLAGLSWRLHMLVKDVESLTLHSATQRVIGYLVSLADEGGGRVTLPAQKSLVASRLNLTPEYFSRILHELQDESLLRIEGRTLEILDPERLNAFGAQVSA